MFEDPGRPMCLKKLFSTENLQVAILTENSEKGPCRRDSVAPIIMRNIPFIMRENQKKNFKWRCSNSRNLFHILVKKK